MPRPNLPETMISTKTGRVLRRDVRPFTFTYKGLTRTVALPGYYADGDDEDAVVVGDDMAPVDAALAEMKAIADGPAAAAGE
jgi:HTH-type transcriptional regulator/antitoxin MqsA